MVQLNFKHVDFAYFKDSETPVLKDINLSIKSGETIGILGATEVQRPVWSIWSVVSTM